MQTGFKYLLPFLMPNPSFGMLAHDTTSENWAKRKSLTSTV
jgi:hypothetical protein